MSEALQRKCHYNVKTSEQKESGCVFRSLACESKRNSSQNWRGLMKLRLKKVMGVMAAAGLVALSVSGVGAAGSASAAAPIKIGVALSYNNTRSGLPISSTSSSSPRRWASSSSAHWSAAIPMAATPPCRTSRSRTSSTRRQSDHPEPRGRLR